jgi:hypothetical protein
MSKVKVITGCDLVGDVFFLSCQIAFFTPFLIFYLQIDDSLKDTWITKSFLAMLISGLILILNQIILLRFHWYYLCESISEEKYNELLYFGIWGLITGLSSIVVSVVGVYLMINFIPFKNNNCHGYDLNICIYGRFYAVLTIFALSLLGFVIICSCLLLCCYIFLGNKKPSENRTEISTTDANNNVNYESITITV